MQNETEVGGEGVNVGTQRFLTLLFNLSFEKSLHGVLCGHIQRKLSFTVHRPDVSTMLYQVSSKTKTQSV